MFDNFIQGKSAKNSLYNRLRLIPIKTAVGSSILVATFPEKVIAEVCEKKRNVSIELDALVAPSDIGKISDGCNAIIPAEILKF